MPEHVHWLWYPHPRGSEEIISVASILESLKTSIGMRVKKLLRTKWAQHRTLGHLQLDRWATAQTDRKPIWTTRGVDVNVTDYAALRQKLDYCHANPLKRGLVERAEDWTWSSYRFYELDDLSGLRMDWDGSWPIV